MALANLRYINALNNNNNNNNNNGVGISSFSALTITTRNSTPLPNLSTLTYKMDEKSRRLEKYVRKNYLLVQNDVCDS